MITEKLWHPLAVLPAAIDIPIGGSFPDEWRDMLTDLLEIWASKLGRNKLKMRYYNGKNVLKDFGISIPPSLLNVETVVGWPQKAVDAMAVRSRFDGYTATDYQVQQMLNRMVANTNLRMKYRQAAQSTLIHSCCFATVLMGSDGFPRIDLHSAETAAARWNDAEGRIAYGFTINLFKDGAPYDITMFVDDAAIHLWNSELGSWDWEVYPYKMGRPMMVSLAYRPTFLKPFGQSRITRAVMSITDSAVREALRTEISAEFFTSPQKYLLGADSEAFANTTKWEAYIGNIFAVGRDEDGNLPEYGQLSQGTMQPHTEYMRALAARFSGETNVPISTLGVIHDNPASAEAIYAANEPLIIEVEDFNDSAREMLKNVAQMAMAGYLNVPFDDVPDEYKDFTANFRNPAMPSVVSQTDAMTKLAAVVPGFAGTDVFWEQVGFPEDMRRKVETEVLQNVGLNVIAAYDAS